MTEIEHLLASIDPLVRQYGLVVLAHRLGLAGATIAAIVVIGAVIYGFRRTRADES
jgi:hypothetical protein